MASAPDIARAFEKSAKKLKARNILLRKALTCAYRYIKENSSDLDHLTEQFGRLCSLCSLTIPENERHLQQLQLDTRHTVSAKEAGRFALLVPDSHPPLHDSACAEESPAVADVAYISDSASSSPDTSCLLVPSEQSTPGPVPAVRGAASSSNHESDVDVTSPGLAPLRPIDSEASLESSDDCYHDATDPGSVRRTRPGGIKLPLQQPAASAAERPLGRCTEGTDCILPTSEATSKQEHPGRSVITSSACPLPGSDAPTSSAMPGYDCDATVAVTECARGGSLVDDIVEDPVQSCGLLALSVATTAASGNLGYCNQQKLQQQPVSGVSRSKSDASCLRESGPALEALPATVETAARARSPMAVALFELQFDETALHDGSPPAADRQSACTDVFHDHAPPVPAWRPHAQLSSDCALTHGPPIPPHRSRTPDVTVRPSETGCSDVASCAAMPLFTESVKLEATTAAERDFGKWTSRGKKRLRSKQSKLESFFDNGGTMNRQHGCTDASAPTSGRGQQLTKAPRVEVAAPAELEAKENVPPERQVTCLKSKTGGKKATENGPARDRSLAAACRGDADDNDFDPDETTLRPLKTSVAPVNTLNKHGDLVAPRSVSVRQRSFGSSPSPDFVEPCGTVNHPRTPPSGKISSGTGRRSGLLGRRLAIRKPAEEPAYVYAEVVRGKKRLKLKGYSCRQCVEYFSAMNLTEEEQRKRLDQVCKHRGQKKPPQTPTGFWDMQLEHT